MPSRSTIVLVLGIVIAIGVAMAMRSRVSEDSGPAVQVLGALTDIAAGGFVRGGDHIGYIDWPKNNITEAMLTSENTKPADFEGAVARRPLQKGTPIFKGDLVKSSEGGFMSAVLDPGKRAVSIPVDPTSGNAGFIFPGDHVDLILTLSVSKDGQQARASETIIEDVRVLAIDQMMGNPENKAVLAKTVTLEVTPKQAEEINVAKDLGKISLSLRSLASQQKQGDTEEEDGEASRTFDDLLRNAPAIVDDSGITRDTDVSRMLTPRGLAGSVQVIRGGDRQTVEFSGEGNQDAR